MQPKLYVISLAGILLQCVISKTAPLEGCSSSKPVSQCTYQSNDQPISIGDSAQSKFTFSAVNESLLRALITEGADSNYNKSIIQSHLASPISNSTQSRSRAGLVSAPGALRESRRFNILRRIWNQPKSSPLYLINGTVCRFINFAPVCTTLSTTGLLQSSSGGGGGGASGGAARPPTAGQVSGTGSSVQFATQRNQANQSSLKLRPSMSVEDDSQDIDMSNTVNSTESSQVASHSQQQVANNQIFYSLQRIRPNNFVANRRPFIISPFRRPITRP